MRAIYQPRPEDLWFFLAALVVLVMTVHSAIHRWKARRHWKRLDEQARLERQDRERGCEYLY